MFIVGAMTVTVLAGAILGIHLGDQSIAAAIAAVASVLNAVILVRVRGAQLHIHDDVMDVKRDTDQRKEQVEDLRSLSVERNRQIVRMERLADRLEVLAPQPRSGGRRVYDPVDEGGAE